LRIILRWIFRKWDVGAWTRSIRFRIRTDVGECGKNAVDFLTGREPLSFSRRTLLCGVTK
jgi:hypothetical protein